MTLILLPQLQDQRRQARIRNPVSDVQGIHSTALLFGVFDDLLQFVQLSVGKFGVDLGQGCLPDSRRHGSSASLRV